MTNTNSLFERRREMVTLIGRGLSLSAVADHLSAKHGISTRELHHDWSRRDRWLKSECDNSSARVGALRLLNESHCDYLAFVRDLGHVAGPKADRTIRVVASWRNKADEINETLKEYNEAVDQVAMLNVKSAVQTVVDRYVPEEAAKANGN